jgi:Ni,Fe-hydrogenase maturation factor
MTVFVFGNEDVAADSLPVRILPELRRKFPDADFRLKDPNEDFELPEDAVIIDTVAGLEEVRVFNSPDDFQAPPRMTLHDFDLFSHLQLLKKLGKLPEKIKIIGLPPTISEEKALDSIAAIFLAT